MATSPPLKRKPKLKQSSLCNFLLPNVDLNPPPPPASHHPSPSSSSSSSSSSAAVSAAAVQYERARQENIRRNRDFLLKLGIPAGPLAPKPPLSPQRKRSGLKRRQPPPSPQGPLPPATPLPLRRSTRRRPLPPPSSPAGIEEDSAVGAIDSPAPTYVDSSVLQYACDGAPGYDSPLPPSSPSSPISGFRLIGRTLRDPSLAKIYAADARGAGGGKFLVAAGGHGGFISVFGVDLVEEDEEEGGGDGAAEKGVEGPLLSWRGSRSWVSGVLFAEENPMLLISSSNDGGVFVWDVSKQPSPSSPSSPWSPPVVAESKGLHASGIFAMHRRGSSVATASKDSSVGISQIKMDGQLVAERTISGHHRGVIRGVCFGETKHILADCGADGCICVLDVRLPEPCTLTITSNHLSHVNTVEWCPSNHFLLLSASKDPILRLYDIRNSRESICELQGHVQTTAICNQIYRPTFIDNGSMVVTPGPASKKISMYSVEKGKLVSQGSIGYDANLVLFTGEYTAQSRLWTAGKQINQLSALRFGTSL